MSTPRAVSGIALVGATGQLGEELKRLLAAAGYPGGTIALLDVEDVAGLVTDYGDEARIVVETAEEELSTDRAVCFCGSPDSVRPRASKVVEAGGIAIDCTGGLVEDPEVTLIPPATWFETGDQGTSEFEPAPLLAVPDAGTLLLADLLLALGEGATDAVVDLILPASDVSERGARDLAEQATAVLNFAEIDDGVFERRLAFDIWPTSAGPGALAHRYGGQLGRLGVPLPALNVLRASTFHGVAASVYAPGADLDRVEAALADRGFVTEPGTGDESLDSPVRIAGHARSRCRPPRVDPRGGIWLWAVQDNHAAIAAAAVAVLRRICPL